MYIGRTLSLIISSGILITGLILGIILISRKKFLIGLLLVGGALLLFLSSLLMQTMLLYVVINLVISITGLGIGIYAFYQGKKTAGILALASFGGKIAVIFLSITMNNLVFRFSDNYVDSGLFLLFSLIHGILSITSDVFIYFAIYKFALTSSKDE